MKQLKIKQEFLDNIKNGIMNFYITKENLKMKKICLDYGHKNIDNCDIDCKNYETDWTKVELMVGEHNCYSQDREIFGCQNGEYDLDYCIKERLVVELKQTPMTAFEIGFKLNRFIGDENENYNLVWEIYEFIKDYFKQGDTLYWYDLRLVE